MYHQHSLLPLPLLERRVDHRILFRTECSSSLSTRRSPIDTINIENEWKQKRLTRLLRHKAERTIQSHFAIEQGDLTRLCLREREREREINALTLPDPTGPMIRMSIEDDVSQCE
jgi:hypothetical protein